MNLRNLNLADRFTVARILLVPFLFVLVLLDQWEAFKWILLIAFLTDAIDGIIARRLHLTTVRGSRFDSIADASLFGVAVVGMYSYDPTFFQDQKWLLVAALSLFLLQTILAYVKFSKPTSFHTYLAKLSAVLQAVFILVFFFIGTVLWLFYLALAVSILETIEEIAMVLLLKEWKSDVRSVFLLGSAERDDD